LLVTFSTSDYLLNSVLASIVKSFQHIVSYLCEVKCSKTPASQQQQLSSSHESSQEASAKKIENLAYNCSHLCNTIDSIVKIRSLDNFTPIGPQIKKMLNRTLNEIFINLTDAYPLIAIQFSKIVQLVSME
jgi:hypothetical protein